MFDFLNPVITFNVVTASIFLLGGILLMWSSSELVVRKIPVVARFFRVREMIVVILGVSVFSSMPEFTVSFFANIKGQSDISIGNVIGSNFVTLTFVTALCAFIAPMKVVRETKERESAWMILSSVAILLLSLDGELSRIDGAALLLLYVPYVYAVITGMKKEKGSRTKKPSVKLVFIAVGFLLLGIMGIIAGAQITLDAGINLGERAGIPPVVLGILVFAFGTSLPELAISLAATFKKKAEVTISEIYSSNIFTALVILGLCALFFPMKVSDDIRYHDLPFLILAGSVIQIFLTTGSRLIRLEAAIIMLLYGYFVLGHFFKIPFFM